MCSDELSEQRANHAIKEEEEKLVGFNKEEWHSSCTLDVGGTQGWA